MTKAEKFIPGSLQEARLIVLAMADLQLKAASLLARYTQGGGATMDGIDASDFAAYGLTKVEYTAAMTDLATAHNAVGLSTVLTGGAFDDVVKLGNAA